VIMMYQLPIDMSTSRISTKRATRSPFAHSAPSPYGFVTSVLVAASGGGAGWSVVAVVCDAPVTPAVAGMLLAAGALAWPRQAAERRGR